MRSAFTHVVAILAGAALGASGVAVAATTGNLPLQTWLGVQSIKSQVGTFGDGSQTTIQGQLLQLQRGSASLFTLSSQVKQLDAKLTTFCNRMLVTNPAYTGRLPC